MFSERFLPSLRRLLALRGFTRGFTAQIPCSCSPYQSQRRLLHTEGRNSDSPAYGTLGNATRGIFVGPKYENVDIALEKTWRFRERYTAQLRIECYNVFNQVNFLPFADGTSDPSGGGGVITSSNAFGFATSGLIVGGSSNRQFQFGLKVLF